MHSAHALAARFSDDFLFGVATSAYQIEGAAAQDGRKPSIWDAFSHMPGRVRNGDTGDVACDHYNRLDGDLDLIERLGVGAYRFSLAWPRIVPDGRGPVNARGLDFYDRMIDALAERGIAAFATLYHWDLPLALTGRGGWTDRDTAHAFADYASVVARRFGDRLQSLATFNEPWCSTYLGHLTGEHAPGERSIDAAMAAAHTLNVAHGLAIQAIRAERADVPLGIVLNALSIYPGSDAADDTDAAERAFQFNNGVFFGPIFKGAYHDSFMEALGDKLRIRPGDMRTIAQPLDWWGLNYYTPMTVAHDHAPGTAFPATVNVPADQTAPRTDIGWEVNADGMAHLLRQVYARYDNLPPCFITENGACYNMDRVEDGIVDDQPRIDYFHEHLSVLAELIDGGIPVKGYFAWSLMDNFEWAEGYDMRFGIVHVDFETQRRTIKNSGHWYSALCETHRANALMKTAG